MVAVKEGGDEPLYQTPLIVECEETLVLVRNDGQRVSFKTN